MNAKTTKTEGAAAQKSTPEHPAVVADSRAATTDEQNRIDFNDPTLTEAEAVEKNLADADKAAD